MQINILQVDFNTLGIKLFYKVIDMIIKTWSTWWWAWLSILKVLKVTSLQYLYNISSLQCLYNISKKKLWIEFISEFIKMKLSSSWIIDFLWK